MDQSRHARTDMQTIRRFAKLTQREIRVYLFLTACKNKQTGRCDPSRAAICDGTGLNKSHVSETIAGLQSKGWVIDTADGFDLVPDPGTISLKKVPDPGTKSSRIGNKSGQKKFPIRELKVPDLEQKVPDPGTRRNIVFKQTRTNKEHTQVDEASPDVSKISDAEKVFDFWKRIHKKGPRQTFTDKRKKAVIARLKKYTVSDLFDAIEGCRRTPHNQGYNSTQTKYDDLELICRNDTQLERFIENAGNAPIPDINEKQRGNAYVGKETGDVAEWIPDPPCEICGREICNRADCGETRRQRRLEAA